MSLLDQSRVNNHPYLIVDNMSSNPPSAAVGFEEDIFEADERVHFSRETGTWRFEQDDGTELEYDTAKSQWVPVVSERRLEWHFQASPKLTCSF